MTHTEKGRRMPTLKRKIYPLIGPSEKGPSPKVSSPDCDRMNRLDPYACPIW